MEGAEKGWKVRKLNMHSSKEMLGNGDVPLESSGMLDIGQNPC